VSVAEHGDVAALLALLGLFGYIGGAIGNSVSGGIWTNTLPEALERLLPPTVKPEWEEIYGDLSKQLSYEMGSPAREAIMQAYGIAQRRMLIAGTAVMALAFLFVLVIKNVKVNRQQMKGLVF
jgi:hypothetical protein